MKFVCPGTRLPQFFSPLSPHIPHQGELVSFDSSAQWKWRRVVSYLTRLCSSRTIKTYVLPALSSQPTSTDGRLVQLGYHGKVTAKEMYPDINESALIRKIDIQVVPALCLLFFFTFLDRVNIANAEVYGMGKEIGLVGNQYNVALAIL